jgi:hypothetical protein
MTEKQIEQKVALMKSSNAVGIKELVTVLRPFLKMLRNRFYIVGRCKRIIDDLLILLQFISPE